MSHLNLANLKSSGIFKIIRIKNQKVENELAVHGISKNDKITFDSYYCGRDPLQFIFEGVLISIRRATAECVELDHDV